MTSSAREKAKGRAVSKIGNEGLLQAYRHTLTCVFIGTVAVVSIVTTALLLSGSGHSSLLLLIVLSGALGSFFSALLRLYSFEELPKGFVESGIGRQMLYSVMYSLIPPIVGSIAAAVLYVCFASEIIKSDLFPKFECRIQTCKTFADFVFEFGPGSPDQFAKALFWGFVAGFSERLVPDLLQRMSERVQRSKQTKN